MFYLSREFEQRDSHRYSQMDGRWNCKAVVKTTAWAIMSGRVREEDVEEARRQAGRQGSSEGTKQPTERGTKNLSRNGGSISLRRATNCPQLRITDRGHLLLSCCECSTVDGLHSKAG